MRSIILICLSSLFVMVMPVSGEYFQYEDADGNLRFTDDTANIPENERTKITAFESVRGDSASVFSDEPLLPATPSAAETDEPSNPTRESLDAFREDLDQTASLLNARKEEIQAQVPGTDATASQKKDYLEKINSLNVEIGEYKKQRQIYNEKVKDFNAQLSLKKNIQSQQNE